MENYNENNIKYLEAKKQVRKLKGFYIHAIVYIIVNLMIIASNVYYEGKSITNMENYWTAIFWGIGVFAHGISVFVPNFLFGKNWEERKIKELMNNEK